MKKVLIITAILGVSGTSGYLEGQSLSSCKAYLHNDTLTIENNLLRQDFKWNDGALIRLSAGLVKQNASFIIPDTRPGIAVGNNTIPERGKGELFIKEIPESGVTTAHLRAEVSCKFGELTVKRVFKIFPDCPAIICEIYFRGNYPVTSSVTANPGDMRNIESESARQQIESSQATLDILKIDGPHWHGKSVEFFDITDRNNTLLQEYERLAYRQECQMRGNLLILTNTVSGQRVFLLKEAPVSSVQLNYPGYDFSLKQGEVRVVGPGILPSDISDSVWTRAYGFALGFSQTNDEEGVLTALRRYQATVRRHIPLRDDMIMMNTWGDRSQDKRIGEKFAFEELKAGARLGITHFQLDDGWQTGKSANSAFKGGSFENIWRNPDYWKPDPVKFPAGLSPVVQRGKELGIEVCLWFNPSPDEGNINWEKDADALIDLYRKHGIRTFKIDGVKLPDKMSEVNFRKMLDKVVKETGGDVVFNLDVTAGRRGGYNYFNEYGNIFLENRYTDWRNYYPFWTLRNLWMLSKYIPAQKLQIEFLNIWRNRSNYNNDPFGPSNYSFDYVFAVTMMAQPLAWFEGTGLPEEAFRTGELIKKYRSLQNDIHSGIILPIGDEPDGYCWTGFQSIRDDKGYLLVFRERGTDRTGSLKTWFKEGEEINFTALLGSGSSFRAKAIKGGYVAFELDNPDSFALYRYEITRKL